MSIPLPPTNLRLALGPEGAVYTGYRNIWNSYLASTFEETLIKAKFGNSVVLSSFPNSIWIYPSINSICVAFETNLPAYSHVRYGLTPAYGSQTPVTSEPHFLHVHYITGLLPSTTYHYQLVVRDEWNNISQSIDYSVSTLSVVGKIPLPGAFPGPPYILNTNGAYYYLTQDIHCPTRGLSVGCSGTIIDLNGHTIFYDEGAPLVAENQAWNIYTSSLLSTYGVSSAGYSNKSGCTLVNGRIIQVLTHGTHPDTGLGRGFGPAYGNALGTISGITATYNGIAVSGIVTGTNTITHHNVLTDKGIGPFNRSQGLACIQTGGTSGVPHHYNNLIRRTRHQGIKALRFAATYDHNEIHVDSWATNGFGIMPYTKADNPSYGGPDVVNYNRVYVTGYHGIACRYSANSHHDDNFFCGVSIDPELRDDEYGPISSVMGFRMTQYGGDIYPIINNYWHDNLIIMKMGPDNLGLPNASQTCRGVEFFTDPYLINNVFENNVVKAIVLPGATDLDCYCVAAQGLQSRYLTHEPLYYRGNHFYTNNHFVALADSYGQGSNHRFVGNTYHVIPGGPAYHPIRVGYRTYPTMANRFIDEVGADLSDHLNAGYVADKEYLVGHRIYIAASDGSPIVGATIVVTDSLAWSSPWTYEVVTDASGFATIELLDSRYYTNLTGPNPLLLSSVINHTLIIPGYNPKILTVGEKVANTPATRRTITFTPV